MNISTISRLASLLRQAKPSQAKPSQAISCLLLIVGGATRCANEVPESPKSAPVAQIEEAFSTVGGMRVIPIRFIQMKPEPTSPLSASYSSLLKEIDRANETWAKVGIQFTMAGNEAYYMPDFANPSASESHNWSVVKPQFSAIWSGLDSLYDTFCPENMCDSYPEHNWLRMMAVLKGRSNEILVWVTRTGKQSFSHFPLDGSSIRLGLQTHPSCEQGNCTPGEAATYHLAHELGHYLGVPHSFRDEAVGNCLPIGHPNNPNPFGGSRWDPELQQQLSDGFFYDLIYKRGSNELGDPHVFFNSEAEANAALAQYQVYPMDCGEGISDCFHQWLPTDPYPGSLECVFTYPTGYEERRQHGHAALKGLSFDRATSPGNPLGESSYTGNAMGYYPNGAPTGVILPPAYLLSDSQARLAKKYLRHDVQFLADGSLPTPIQGKWGNRPLLGHRESRMTSHLVDFDGDGQRDLAVWKPPGDSSSDGQFTVLLSSNCYDANAPLIQSFGKLGDYPILGDFDGDGKTDFGVIQPGNGLNRNDPFNTALYWRWCPSNLGSNPCASGNVISVPFGDRGDIPLPGVEFNGGPGTANELAVFRPAYQHVKWANMFGTPLHYVDTIVTDGLNPNLDGIELLHGLYDQDGLTDVVAQMPRWRAGYPVTSRPRYFFFQSSNNWASSYRDFPGTLTDQPYDGGSPFAFSVRGVAKKTTLPGGSVDWRGSVGLWDPDERKFHTMWTPLSSSTIQTCTALFANRVEHPLSGNVDIDGDNKGELVSVLLPSSYGGQGGVRMVKTNTCTTTFTLSSNITMSTVPFITGPFFGGSSCPSLNYPTQDYLVTVDTSRPDSYRWRLWQLQSTGVTVVLTRDFGVAGSIIL